MENTSMEETGEKLINLLNRSLVALQEADAVREDYQDVSARRNVIADIEGYIYHLTTRKLNEQ
jgi:hypothetical protein